MAGRKRQGWTFQCRVSGLRKSNLKAIALETLKSELFLEKGLWPQTRGEASILELRFLSKYVLGHAKKSNTLPRGFCEFKARPCSSLVGKAFLPQRPFGKPSWVSKFSWAGPREVPHVAGVSFFEGALVSFFEGALVVWQRIFRGLACEAPFLGSARRGGKSIWRITLTR